MLALFGRAILFVCAGVALAGCGVMGSSASVSPDEQAFKDIATGDYAFSQKDFQPRQAKAPRDAYLELDLAAAYQGLGRMDLAEALDRQAMVDGKDVYPDTVSFDRDKGKTIAYIACENISIYRNHSSDGGCEAVVPHAAEPAPAPKNFVVFFDFNRTAVTGEAQGIVAEAVKTAKSNGVASIQVTGHTDTVGSESYNQKLSMKRAAAVKYAMQQSGLTGTQIAVDGKGFHDLLVPTGPDIREPQNRRAVITLTPPAQTVSSR